MRNPPRALCLPLLALALACSKTPPDASGDASPVGPPSAAAAPGPSSGARAELDFDPADAPPASMRLLDPGQPPRRRLRYAWRTGQRETLVMDLRTSASTEEGTSKQPENRASAGAHRSGHRSAGDVAGGRTLVTRGA